MTSCISRFDGALIWWIQETGESGTVRLRMDKNGLIKELITRLQSDPKTEKASRIMAYLDKSGVSQDYLCEVTKFAHKYLPHSFEVNIRPKEPSYPISPDAEGWVYTGDNIPKM